MTDNLHDIKAEESVIGSCLIDPDSILLLMGDLEYADFHDHGLGMIWKAMVDMTNESRQVDPLTVIGWFKDRNALEVVGGETALLGLINMPYTSVHVREYAHTVVSKSRRRQSMKLAAKYAKWVADPDVADPDARMMAALADTDSRDDTLVMNNDAWNRYAELIEKRAAGGGLVGLETGLIDLDNCIGGLRQGSFVVVGARPHNGKTTLLECIADNVASAGHRVLFASLEMSREQLQDRRIVRQTGLAKRRVERGQQINKIMAGVGQLHDQTIHYIDDGSLRTDKLLSQSYQVKSQSGLDLIVVDYIQLLDDLPHLVGTNDTGRLSHISRRLKMIARELKVPVLVASQLNRGVEQRADKRPIMSDLRQSGRIEEDADVVMLLYREAYYNTKLKGTSDDITECNVIKNREDGVTGVLNFGYLDEKVVCLSRETGADHV
jgi:replicative DNA helicase